jgi:peptidoglycan/xylan/chitin deacetylase (PgdA/CDA1 family)
MAFWRPALRVLCYHRVHPDHRDRWTVTSAQLDEQLRYLVRAGFRFIRARDLIGGAPLPEQALLITFDDGYVDNLEHAQPVLRAHGARATIFVTTGFAGQRPAWSAQGGELMSPEQLRRLDPDVIELALHSHAHRAFGSISLDEVEEDVRRNIAYFREHGVPVTPALAYPYGSRPSGSMPELSKRLASLGIAAAFRIGNRLNRLPIQDPYQIQRIDVRGDRSQAAFRRRLWLGRLL